MAKSTRKTASRRTKAAARDGDGEDKTTIALRKLFANAQAREALRELLQACVVPGDHALKYKKIALDIEKTFIDTKINPENLEHFTNGETKNAQDEAHLHAYARWMERQFALNLPVSKRKLVLTTLKKQEIDLIGQIKAAVSAQKMSEFEEQAEAVARPHNERLFYANLLASFSADENSAQHFIDNVIGGEGDERTARFFMYRYTRRSRWIYRSHYTFRARKDELRSERATTGRPAIPFYICDFHAVGFGGTGIVKSSGYVLAQRSTLYLFGNLDGRGIHVAAIPYQCFERPTDELRGMALSMHMTKVEVTPVAGRVLLRRDIAPMLAESELAGALPESRAIVEYFGGDDRYLRDIGNDVGIALKAPATTTEGGVIEDYSGLIKRFGGELRNALKGRLKDVEGDIFEGPFLPENLRGATALSMKRGG